MNKNAWSYTNNCVFFYTISLPITKENFIEKLNSMDYTILKYGRKYGIYEFIPDKFIDKYGEDELLLQYQKDKEVAYNNLNPNERNSITILDFYLWCENNKDIKRDLLAERSKIFVYDQQGKVVAKPYSYWGVDSIIYYVIDGVEYNDLINNSIGEVWIAFSSRSNIWLPEVDFHVIAATSEKNEANRELAFLNTPRLNSFIRALKAKTEELGGKWNSDPDYDGVCSEDGILIDGKIIYQEDIEEGLIKNYES
jgi:hypothetical protein